MGTRVGVLSVQGDFLEHCVALSGVGAEPVQVRVPSDLLGCDALVLPGGESTAMSMLIRSSGLEDALKDLLADGMPMFGTCAGMILLAREISDGRPDQISFGAIDIAVRRNGFGRQIRSFEADLDIVGLDGPPVRAVFIRAPVVESVGDGTSVLASVQYEFSDLRSETVPVVCAQGRVLVSSFHPELTDDTRLHEMFLNMIEDSK